MGNQAKSLPMKKIISVNAESLPEKAGKKLTQAEMEYELDHCSAPWMCPEACYKACNGCLEGKYGGK